MRPDPFLLACQRPGSVRLLAAADILARRAQPRPDPLGRYLRELALARQIAVLHRVQYLDPRVAQGGCVMAQRSGLLSGLLSGLSGLSGLSPRMVPMPLDGSGARVERLLMHHIKLCRPHIERVAKEQTLPQGVVWTITLEGRDLESLSVAPQAWRALQALWPAQRDDFARCQKEAAGAAPGCIPVLMMVRSAAAGPENLMALALLVPGSAKLDPGEGS